MAEPATVCTGRCRLGTPDPTCTAHGPGVPVVDLNQMIRDLNQRADDCRARAAHLDLLAVEERQHAAYLEDLVTTLWGSR